MNNGHNIGLTAVLMEPHPLFHSAIATLLAGCDIEVVGAATSAAGAAALIEKHGPDLLVGELDVPEGRDEALRVVSLARLRDPSLTVIALSATDDPRLIDAAFEAGVSAYVLKTSDPDVIATAIHQAFKPSLYVALRPALRSVPDAGRAGRTAQADPARAGDPRARRRRAFEPSGGSALVGHRPDGEVPPGQRLPQARGEEPLRRRTVGAGERRAAGGGVGRGRVDLRRRQPAGTATATEMATGRPRLFLSRKHRDDAERVLPGPGTAATDRSGVPAGSDLHRDAEQVLDGGRGDDQLSRRLE